MEKEFNLKEKREKIKNRIIHNNCSQGCKTKMVAIFMEVLEQDKEFIKRLKEKIRLTETDLFFQQRVFEELDKLAGNK